MQEGGEASFPCWPRRQNQVPLLAAEGATSPPLPPPISRVRSVLAASSSSSSSSSSSPSSPSSLSLASSSSTFSSSPSSSSISSPSLWQRRNNVSGQGRRSKPVRERRLLKPFSEPALFTMEDIRAVEADGEKALTAVSHGVYRRCMTDTDFNNVHGWPSQAAPDLLQLFNIFQFNKPEKPPARMLINVTLVGNILPVRLLVAYDASVLDVIKASLKAYVKEGRLPRHCIKNHNYGLHYSPFCLENIDPTESIYSLGTRNFFLFQRESQLMNPTQSPNKTKPWWNIFGLMLT